jgi:hypothetical protein
MITTMRTSFIFIAALTVSACATHTRPIVVGIPDYSAPSASSTLSSIPPAKIRVLPFNDGRKDLEGEVTAAFGVPMGHIRFEPSPATVLGRVVVSEFKAAGHTVADSTEGPQISGIVRVFNAHTDTTPLYWDIIGSLAVSLQVSSARGITLGDPLEYHAQCTDRTYIWPSEAVISGVMNKCLNEFASQLRNDARVTDALRKALSGP